ncbi:MAG: hypothetical protein WA002_10630, partial [Candidatus Acidiferrales bacterium]
IYLINKAYLPREEVPALNQFIHNPFVLSAYALFYVVTLSHRFLESEQKAQARASERLSMSFARRWSNPVFKIFLLSAGCTATLLVLAAFWFRGPTK